RFQQLALFTARSLEHFTRDVAEAKASRTFVLNERSLTDQLCELTGREPPRQVHLEEPILRVHESGGESEIGPVRGGDRRDTERIALDGDGRRCSSHCEISIERRK